MKKVCILLLAVQCYITGAEVLPDKLLSIKATFPFASSVLKPNVTPFDHCEKNVIPPNVYNIPEYEINLDLPAEERWTKVVSDRRAQIIALIENIKQNCDLLFGKSLFWMVNEFLPMLTETLPIEYRKELLGISSVTGLTVGEITLFNVFYEFFSVCTSIVARNENGVLYHGRNLDFGLFLGWDPANHTWQTTNLLKPLIVKLNFTQNNKTLYHSINYAGHTGILTAVKPGKFALSIDERFKLDGGYVGIAEWILGMRNQQWISFLTRDVMEKCNSYLCAQKMLSKPPLVAPVYFILSGIRPSDGSIITRGRNDFSIWPLGQKQRNQTGNWFLVQTNFDQWKKPPFYDDRRTPAIFCMDKEGNKDVSQTLKNVLSTRPVLNKLTTYTAIMSAQKNLLEVWIQSCPDPCWPW
ncbi:Acid ceramidase [Frankliniella fusca]|uniref:Acid ceramidase n=1 Tax=Frankliniella fusca TaxID=407009 RepID=A0AAE1L962_9NEOP|nr:Acid ceramidase [Frankliniella fusca]